MGQATDERTGDALISPLTAESGARALSEACRGVGLDSTGAELIRIGSNAVYRLQGRVIVRIATSTAAAENARKQVAVANWLAEHEYPAVRALPVDQPVEVDGRVATFWESVSERTLFASIGQVADLIRRLHELPPPTTLALPPTRPFEHAWDRLGQVVGLPESDVEFMTERLRKLSNQYGSLEFALPPGPIHGDANVGNVIMDRDGRPVLSDLDGFATGPREWDLVQTALFFERFGWHTEEEYRTFVEVYGFDLLEWPGYAVLADAREVMMTLWLASTGNGGERAVGESRKRIDAMRTGVSRRDWAPF